MIIELNDHTRSRLIRIKTMASIHEKLYRSENLSKIVLSDYIEDLAEQLQGKFELNGKQGTEFRITFRRRE